ncbi:MAG: hypothetical protein WEB52_00765 [Dehalococcoidia bacterium]
MQFIFALLWLVGLLVAAPLAILGGILVARHGGWRPRVAIPLGVVLGAAAAPTFLISAYLIVGWALAILLWLFGLAWHRLVGNIRVVQIAFSVTFTIAWLAVTSASQAADRYGDPLGLATDGAILLSLLASCLIVLEFSALAWVRRPSENIVEEPVGSLAA